MGLARSIRSTVFKLRRNLCNYCFIQRSAKYIFIDIRLNNQPRLVVIFLPSQQMGFDTKGNIRCARSGKSNGLPICESPDWELCICSLTKLKGWLTVTLRGPHAYQKLNIPRIKGLEADNLCPHRQLLHTITVSMFNDCVELKL